MQKIHRALAVHLSTLALIFAALSPLAIPTTAYACTYPNDQRLTENQRLCGEDSAKEWSCDVNRCLTTASAQNIREGFKECAEIADETERQTCHDNYASQESGVNAGDNGAKSLGSKGTVGASIAAIYAGLSIYTSAGIKLDGNSCTSRYVFLGGSAIMVLTEIYMKLMAEKKFKEIGKKYRDEQLSADAYAAQIRALEYLKEEQQEVETLAKTRKNAYILQMVAFTASLALALVESYTEWLTQCSTVAKTAGKAKSIANGIFLTTSTQVAIASAVALAWSTYLMKAAKDEESKAGGNVEKLSAVIQKFQDTMGGSSYCSPTAREDLSNGDCYCYEASGDKNLNRSNSQTCQALWAARSNSLNISAGDYRTKVAVKTSVCMLQNGQTDRDCKCRRLINKTTGENACLKVPMGSNNLGTLGPALGLSSLSSTFGNLANGSTSFGSLNGSSLNKQLAKSRKVLQGTVAKINQERANDQKPPISIDPRRFEQAALKSISPKQISAAASISLGNLSTNSRPQIGALANAIKSADAKNGLKRTNVMSGGGGLKSKGSRSDGNDAFAFLNSDGGSQGKVVGGPEQEKYDYKDNDIIKNKGVSIWKVISSRYATSGVRRLFQEEEKKGK